ncbi:GTPase ObgE [Haliovirga abyssi]|uniref:GTPase Obg n=1 Tax=Haliovirga abyssi TaxID=2996794 RepID=A0AAU9DC19_9FUSO|nr:GTPase ObgE [Haliovirga abyssi]BDU51021.1 GTPase Obg [Haliovirga abyssi]
MFIDEAVVTLKSGKGGDGSAAFRREKYIQFGGPSGGDGGRGGDIIFVADSNINTLIDFKYRKKYVAGNGENGQKKRMYGKWGEDLIIKVPVGTMLRDYETNELLMDLSEENVERVFLKGGRGGRGNIHFKTSTRRAPKIAEIGRKGKEIKIKLELKLLADVALVGYPNVGKSSLINKVSASKSKVANYHFTTLNPKLGVVRVEDTKSFVVADIPGLVEGAHQGVGLGDKFLRHIERCKIIYHLIDVSGTEGRDPIDDYEKINLELENYSEKLSNKKQIVLANKMDLAYNDENFNALKKYLEEKNIEIYPVSVLLNKGLKEVIYRTYDILQTIPREQIEEEKDVSELLVERGMEQPEWDINKIDEGFYEVSGRVVDSLLNRFVLNSEEAIVQFLHMLKEKGLENKLRNFGVKDGDVIKIENIEFDFVE